EKPTEQPQPSETQLSIQSETDKLIVNLNNENKTLHETNKQLSKDTKQLQKKIDSLNTELTKKEENIRHLKGRKPLPAPVQTRIEYETKYVTSEKCVKCQINNITSKYESLCRKTIYLAAYTLIMVFAAIMKNTVLRNDIFSFFHNMKNGVTSFIKGILNTSFSVGSQILTATASTSKALYWIPSIFVILAATGIIGTIIFYIIKSIIPFFRAYWNFTQTAVTIILFSLLICFADIINIKGVLSINLVVLFIIADLAIMVIRAVYDCIKNW
ncbi:MAG: DUF6040 family protein, partial [Clostridiales bacterium]|nr:DUF6040 family protein [Clostridiales bacterium]